LNTFFNFIVEHITVLLQFIYLYIQDTIYTTSVLVVLSGKDDRKLEKKRKEPEHGPGRPRNVQREHEAALSA